MDPLLLEYYNNELIFLREMGRVFAEEHPKIAKRLGMHELETKDPYVERLLESFSFMSARMQIKLDAEFPKFTQRLLEVVYPNYVSPTPSMSVVKLLPDLTKGDLSKGVKVAKQTPLFAKVPFGETTSCQFKTTQDVTLWPIEITEVQLTGTPPDIYNLAYKLPEHIKVQGALRIKLRTLNEEVTFAKLSGLERLPFYLCGEEGIASHLFELLHTSAVGLCIDKPNHYNTSPYIVTDALSYEGLEPSQTVLPLNWQAFHGHNLLHTYFANPNVFYFFALSKLAEGLKTIQGTEAELIILLSRHPDKLSKLVSSEHFSLFCSPIVNLFERPTDKMIVSQHKHEFHFQIDKANPLDYEVHSVSEIIGDQDEQTNNHVFRSLYQTINQDKGNYGRYFTVQRDLRTPSESARKYGTRTAYTGTEVFISLVDQNEAPYPLKHANLSVKALATNRDLPLLVPRNGEDDLTTSSSIPVSKIGIIRPMSTPNAPLADRNIAWRLIRFLGFSYFPLIELDSKESSQAIRDILGLFARTEDETSALQIDSIIGIDIKPVTKRLPGVGPLIYGRGVSIKLTVDEKGFSGVSPFLLGLIIERWLSRHVSINTFIQFELHSMQRGLLYCWPVRVGLRGIV